MKTLIVTSILFLILSGCSGFFYEHSLPAGYYGGGPARGECNGSGCYRPYYCPPYYYDCNSKGNRK